MKVVVIGATGTIGAAVADALEPRHQVVGASRTGPVKVDLNDQYLVGLPVTIGRQVGVHRPDA